MRARGISLVVEVAEVEFPQAVLKSPSPFVLETDQLHHLHHLHHFSEKSSFSGWWSGWWRWWSSLLLVQASGICPVHPAPKKNT
jgi:hypothetical protein